MWIQKLVFEFYIYRNRQVTHYSVDLKIDEMCVISGLRMDGRTHHVKIRPPPCQIQIFIGNDIDTPFLT